MPLFRRLVERVRIPKGLLEDSSWNITVQQAIGIQKKLRDKVVSNTDPDKVDLIAGVDMSLEGDTARAAVVVLNFPALEPIEEKTAIRRISFPYVPGLLAFRELPSVLDAIERLKTLPDLFVVDGQGIAHPRRFGIASHLGVLLDTPSIGCGKSRLCGKHDAPKPIRGSFEYLHDGDDVIGAALVTRDNTNPIYVSVGHKVSLDWAVDLVLKCSPKYRIPEPTRLADRVSGGGGVVRAQKSPL